MISTLVWGHFLKCSSSTRTGLGIGMLSAPSTQSSPLSWLGVLLQHSHCPLAVVPGILSNTA